MSSVLMYMHATYVQTKAKQFTYLASRIADVLGVRQSGQDDLDAGRELFGQPVELATSVGVVELVERVEEEDERLLFRNATQVQQELLRQRL